MMTGHLIFQEISYDGTLSDDEARFVMAIDVQAAGTGFAPLLKGDMAILPAKLPGGLRIIREDGQYVLVAEHPGHFKFQLEVVAKIQRAEPWNEISFTGPVAPIASVTAQGAGADTDVQLQDGTLLEAIKTNNISRVTGYLAADQTVSLRWQSQAAEVTHEALFTVDSVITAEVTPTVIKYVSKFHYTVAQGSAGEITLAMPARQTLTSLDGEQIRDWHLAAAGDGQTLTVAFIKPVDASYDLTIQSEQAVDSASTTVTLKPPEPLKADRESGSLTISAEDETVEISAPANVRQVNAPDNAVAAYEFDARPLALALTLKPIEPEITAGDRVSAQLEEARLVVLHHLTLDVEKSGIYALELAPQAGFSVADVQGDGIDDWNIENGKIEVAYSSRVLGERELEVRLEEPLSNFPPQIAIARLRVAGAQKETAQIGVAAVAGLQVRTGTLAGLREIPVSRLSNHSNEILAYLADQPDWQLTIPGERLAPRVVADVFNLATIGDGIVGGSAIIRYGIVNQGIQEFKVRVPADFKNVDFTGPNIRSKRQSGEIWTIGLQDKAWGGYTLVVTYDYPFDAGGGTLPVGGVHALEVERETGTIAVTTAASLELTPELTGETLQRIDEAELSDADRSLITRPVVLAYQYTGGEYDLALNAKRFAGQPVLEAIADRTQITSVLTAGGEMLTQASFMVKNNEKEFQRFQLPENAALWSCYVNGQPAKPETDGNWVLVPLPRSADRDQAFAVDIMYAQTNAALGSIFGKELRLAAPRTDVPNTYAEWQVFVPPAFRLSHFGGSMSVAEGTTYELFDAWEKFLSFYGEVLREAGGAILFIGALALLVIALVISAAQRGWNGVITLIVVVAILSVLSAMMLPALATAKRRAQRMNSVNNLKEIGLAAKIFAGDNHDRLPSSFDEMKDELGTDKITYDTETGERFTYLGGGLSLDDLKPDSVLAYSPIIAGHCEVLYADGSVAQISSDEFGSLSQRGLVQMTGPTDIAERQRELINRGQMEMPPEGHTASSISSPVVEAPAMNAVNGSAAAIPTAAPQPGTLSGGGGVGGFGGGTSFAARAPLPTVSGIRSIRIDLPQTGQPFLFTKVLNIGDEPLTIRARIMPLSAFETLQMTWQTAAFLLGLALWWTQWRRADRSSFLLTVALVLVLGSVCSLLVEHRALHDALIVGFPAAALALISLAIWKYWPRGGNHETDRGTAPGVTPPFVAPVRFAGVAAVVLLLALSLGGATAAPNTNLVHELAVASIVSANYSGTVNDRVALVDAELKFTAEKAGQRVRVFGADVAVQQFTVRCGKAELLRRGDNLVVRLDSREATVEIKMLVKITGDVTKRELAFAAPPALSSQVEFTLDEPQAEVDFPTAIAFQRFLERDETRIEAVQGGADHIDLLWTPRMKRAEEIAATIFCRNNSLAVFGDNVLNIYSTLDYQIAEGEMRQARVQLPAGQRLLRVEGNEIRAWEIKEENGQQVVVVDLLKGVSSSWWLTLETEKIFGALPVSEAVAVPHALDAQRESGLVALQGAEGLDLAVESAPGLERVDANEFPQISTAPAGKLFSVFQFPRAGFGLQIRAAAIQPEIEAVSRNYFSVSAEQVSLSAAIDFTIKRAGVFTLEALLPDGYRLDSVNGDNIQQWTEKDEAGGRVIEVALKDRTVGAYTLALELTRDLNALPGLLTLAGVHPPGAAKLNGYVAVTAAPGVAVSAESAGGLTEIPAVSLPDYSMSGGAGSALAYEFISAEPGPVPRWSLSVTTETVAAWVRAEIVDTFTLADALVNGRALVRYDIANAPVKELLVRVPEDFRNVEITGPNIRSRERAGNLWRVKLQNPAYGTYTLAITWDSPLSTGTNAMELAGVSAEGVERETGFLAISAKAPLQVEESAAVNLQRVDVGEFPDWAGAPDNAATLAYRYIRPGYKLALGVRRLEEAAVLQAMIESAQFTSVVADDGQMMTEMSLSLNSNGRQFLAVELPPGVQSGGVWSAFVGGEPVRPSWRDGELLLPIEQSAADGSALSVQLTYVGTNAFPRRRGEVALVSPSFDAPLKNARWEIYLPPDYDYENFSGTMVREIAAAAGRGTSNFSSLEYSRMEQASQSAMESEARHEMSEAQRQLAAGDVRAANESFSRAKAVLPAQGGAGLDEFQQNLQAAAASNLIQAQSDFSIQNSGLSGENGGGQTGLEYDDAAAAEQWSKLQQAQEITTTAIQPLRVNLPVRGQQFTFTQVLQTETDRPMVIQLYAANTRMINWPMRTVAMAGAFVLLWGGVAVGEGRIRKVNRRKSQ